MYPLGAKKGTKPFDGSENLTQVKGEKKDDKRSNYHVMTDSTENWTVSLSATF